MRVSAYVPCRDNARSVGEALRSLLGQTRVPGELVLVNDGGDPASAEIARSLGVPVHELGANLGRGAARASAHARLAGDVIVCCDATNALDPDFIERGLRWFEDPAVGAVFGRLRASFTDTAAERWKDRHLFKTGLEPAVSRRAVLSTWGALVRASAAASVGGYQEALRHSEDADLGARLQAAGYQVVYDPSLGVRSTVRNTVGQVLERYWRWYVGAEQRGTVRFVFDQARVALRILLPADLSARDLGAAAITLALPAACLWHSLKPRPAARR